MLGKTYTTFHKNHITLQQRYRLRGYIKFSDLIMALLIAEKNSELLIKNHMSRPTRSKAFPLWHDRLGHPGTIMMQKIIEGSQGHSMKSQEIYQENKRTCVVCSLGKLIIRSSPSKIDKTITKIP